MAREEGVAMPAHSHHEDRPERSPSRHGSRDRVGPRDDDIALMGEPAGLSPQAALALQRAVGNAAVSRLITTRRPPPGGGPGHDRHVQRVVDESERLLVKPAILADITEADLRELLDSYRLTEAQKEAAVKRWRTRKDHAVEELRPKSVPDLLDMAIPKNDRAGVDEFVKNRTREEQLDDSRAPNRSRRHTFRRGDERSPEQIQEAGGFFGWGVTSIQDARRIAGNWQDMTPQEQRDWVRTWKAQTPPKHLMQPYVATGVGEAQKGGYEYEIDIPLSFSPGSGTRVETDTGDLDTATVIAINLNAAADDGEVIFVTGIPTTYIKYEGKPLGAPPVPPKPKSAAPPKSKPGPPVPPRPPGLRSRPVGGA